MYKKVIMFILTGILVLNTGVSTSAGQVEKTSSGKTFKSSWSATAKNSSGNGTLTYGYNTDWINEDFAWANHKNYSHYASLKNANGWHTSSSKKKGAIAKIEVRHKYDGNVIKYRCNW